MSGQTILAFDFGMSRIGVAVGQTITLSATPLHALTARQGNPQWELVNDLMKNWSPQALVVGIPTKMDGTTLYVTKPAKRFAQQLQERYKKKVYHNDERLSTVAARAQLFEQGGFRHLKRTDIDSFAAKLILESWFLNRKKQNNDV